MSKCKDCLNLFVAKETFHIKARCLRSGIDITDHFDVQECTHYVSREMLKELLETLSEGSSPESSIDSLIMKNKFTGSGGHAPRFNIDGN